VSGREASAADFGRHRELVEAFPAASRDGDFGRLLAVLSAEVVLRADDGEAGAVRAMGGQIRAAFVFTIEPDRIAGTDIIMDPSHLAAPDVTIG
jgi:hypothetical protein